MRIFKNRWFDRFAGNEGISDKQLKDAVDEIEAGMVEANLGGNVFKKRLARSGEGKAGGYRTIVFFKSGERTFFNMRIQSQIVIMLTRKNCVFLRKCRKNTFR